MVRKSTTIAVTSMLVATGLLMGACSGDDEDPKGGTGGGSGTGATAGKGGTANAGTGGTGTAGMSTGGTGTAGTGGSTGGTTGGTTAAGGAGAGGTAGTATGGGGGGGMEGFACLGKAATCNSITEFPATTAVAWGSGDFSGGITVFSPEGSTFSRDTTITDGIKVSGTVDNYGFGFGLWFSSCMSLAAFTGVEFTISGTTTAATPNVIELQVQTNSNYPWQPDPTAMKGGCTAMNAMNPWGECISPTSAVTMMPTPTAMPVTWAQVAGGMPVPWDATSSPMEVIGIQWQFPWTGPTDTPYTVDVTLADVKLTGAAMETACMVVTGMGGMGGMGGMAGTAGQSSGGAGAGGMAGGGAGGAGAGGAGSGNAGTAGMSGSGSSGGGAGGNG